MIPKVTLLKGIHSKISVIKIVLNSKESSAKYVIPEPTKFELVKKISRKYSLMTTLHGLNRSVRAETKFTKIIWTILFLASTGAGLFIIANATRDFYNFDVLTLTKRIKTNSSILPAVTFCSDIQGLEQLFSKSAFITKNSSSYNLTSEHFQTNPNYGYSKCIKFNNFPRPMCYANNIYHDKLVFELHNDSSFTFLDVFISDNYLTSFDWSEFKGRITPSNKVFYGMTKHIETKLGKPHGNSDCTDEITDVTYRKRNCLLQCKNEQTVSKYGCSVTGDSNRICDAQKFESVEFDSICDKQCPQECTLTRYEAISSNQASFIQSVQVAYLDLSLMQLSEIPKMNGFVFISTIGSAMLLYFGARWLTFVEFLEYLIELYFVVVLKRVK